jgi:hypothetical protein
MPDRANLLDDSAGEFFAADASARDQATHSLKAKKRLLI